MSDDRRKHRKQMLRGEIAAVESLVRGQSKWTVGRHARDRMTVKGVFMTQVMDVLKSGYVVEVNENNDLCVVFRKEYDGFSVCVVVSLRTRWVVTVWKNGIEDKHKSLDTGKYQWQVDVRDVMAAFA